MTNDPFEPGESDISMHLPEIIPVVKYPGFSKFHYDEKLEILTDEMVHREPDTSVEIMLRNAGITYDEYKSIIADDGYLKLLRAKALRIKFAPYVPQILETTAIEAANGDDAKLKSALQIMGTIAPDNAILINQNLANMSDAELKLETEKLMRSLNGKEDT